MNFFDDERPKMGSMPCWLDGRSVLHSIEFYPLEDELDRWRLRLMCPIGLYRERLVNITDIPNLIREYRLSPEGFISLMFNEVAPTKRAARAPPSPIATIEDEDF